jgi:hypothetical protein
MKFHGYHNHSGSQSRAHSWCCTFWGFRQIYCHVPTLLISYRITSFPRYLLWCTFSSIFLILLKNYILKVNRFQAELNSNWPWSHLFKGGESKIATAWSLKPLSGQHSQTTYQEKEKKNLNENLSQVSDALSSVTDHTVLEFWWLM